MTQQEIQAFFPFWVKPLFYDLTYARPTNAWLFHKFWPWFRDERWAANAHKWTRKRDCDNFARRFVMECQDAHADSGHPDEALAVGEFLYIATTHVKGPHAIVVAFTEDATPVFIEPQTGQRLALHPLEVQSCFHVSF